MSQVADRPARTILVPTDFSDTAQTAVRVARTYAAALSATVHLLHIAGRDEQATTTLLTGEASAFGPGIGVTTALRFGDPAQAIVEYARSQGIDLIVMGTHGRTGVSRALLGSVTERVVRSAPCPVLAVPGDLPPRAVAAREREAAVSPLRRCLVCGASSDDLICTSCRARIRGEALDRKQREERAGRLDR
jgi:nucleotide-binding universal stress UspA family protein